MNNLLNIIVCLSIFLATSLTSVAWGQVTTEDQKVITPEEVNTLAKNDQNSNGVIEGSEYAVDPFTKDDQSD